MMIDERVGMPPVAPEPPGAYDVVVVGCHGGAGTTTVTRMLVNAADCGTNLVDPAGAAVILVARSTPHGARCATKVLTAAREQGVCTIAVVMVGDGPWPEARLATQRLRILEGLGPELIRLPYIPRWRYVDDPLAHPLPRRVISAVRRLSSLIPPSTSEG